MCPVLIGRDTELTRLDMMLMDVLGRQGRTVVISGDAGVGKTAVVRRFVEGVPPRRAQVLWAECIEIEARRPFGPFMDIARAMKRSGGLPIAEREARLTEADRYRLHTGFTSLFTDLAEERPVIAVIEDLHWADDATLELFPYLARKLRDAPLLLIGTYRREEVGRRHPLRAMLAELSRLRSLRDIVLAPLGEPEVGEFLSQAMGLDRPPTADFRRAIFATCEGNPLFIEEVLRALAQRGDIEFHDGAWRRTKPVADIPIPDSLRDAILERFRALPSDTQSVVLHAAVIGQVFEFSLLSAVTGTDEAMVTTAIRQAVEAQLVVERTDEARRERFAFRHALTRASVLLELLQPERRRIHAVVAAAMETRGGSDGVGLAEALAYHFDEARNGERALYYHDIAAHEAYRSFAFARVVQHLERAVELTSGNEPPLGDLLLRLADAAYLAAMPRRALQAAEEARRWFERRGHGPSAGLALTRSASYRWFLGETRGARGEALDAARLLEPLGRTAELAAAYAKVGRLAGLDLDYAAAVEWGARAADIAAEVRAVGVRVDALITIGSAHRWLGRGEGVALLREAISIAIAHDLIEAAMRGLHNLSIALFATGAALAEVRRVHDEMFAYARLHGFRTDVVIADEAIEAVDVGDWDVARSCVAEARGESVWTAQLELIDAFMRTGREGPQLSLPVLERARRRLRGASGNHRVTGLSMLGRVSSIAGDPAATLADLEGIAADLRRGFYTGRQVDEAPVCAIAAASVLDDHAAAAEWIGVALADEGRVRRGSVRARQAFAQAAATKDVNASIRLLGISAGCFTDSSLPVGASLARRRRVELFIGRDADGDREAAEAEVAAIAEYWRKARATWYLGQLENWAKARRLALPAETPLTSEPPAAGRSPLTIREREVATLVARGLTNKQIAAKLTISERTAEGHVVRILSKLGLRSRVQIPPSSATAHPQGKELHAGGEVSAHLNDT